VDLSASRVRTWPLQCETRGRDGVVVVAGWLGENNAPRYFFRVMKKHGAAGDASIKKDSPRPGKGRASFNRPETPRHFRRREYAGRGSFRAAAGLVRTAAKPAKASPAPPGGRALPAAAAKQLPPSSARMAAGGPEPHLTPLRGAQWLPAHCPRAGQQHPPLGARQQDRSSPGSRGQRPLAADPPRPSAGAWGSFRE